MGYKYFDQDYDDFLAHAEIKQGDMKYGLPEKKAYPMPDRKHVMSAIKFFNYVSPKDEEKLAKAILARMEEYGISEVNVGPDNRFGKYYEKTSLKHYQIKGAKHGVRRWQNPDGSWTPAGRARYGKGGAPRGSYKDDGIQPPTAKGKGRLADADDDRNLFRDENVKSDSTIIKEQKRFSNYVDNVVRKSRRGEPYFDKVRAVNKLREDERVKNAVDPELKYHIAKMLLSDTNPWKPERTDDYSNLLKTKTEQLVGTENKNLSIVGRAIETAGYKEVGFLQYSGAEYDLEMLRKRIGRGSEDGFVDPALKDEYDAVKQQFKELKKQYKENLKNIVESYEEESARQNSTIETDTPDHSPNGNNDAPIPEPTRLEKKLERTQEKLKIAEEKQSSEKYQKNVEKKDKLERQLEALGLKTQKIRDNKLFRDKEPGFFDRMKLNKEARLQKKLSKINKKINKVDDSVNKLAKKQDKYQQKVDRQYKYDARTREAMREARENGYDSLTEEQRKLLREVANSNT